jgi:hypothetical protein
LGRFGHAAGHAAEDWQPVYEDASIRVAIDTASLSRSEPNVMFREREVVRQPKMDPAAMRKIQEIQYRRRVDCAHRRLSVLSRAVFSEQGTLMHYEATRPFIADWVAPQSERELRLLDTVCGQA